MRTTEQLLEGIDVLERAEREALELLKRELDAVESGPMKPLPETLAQQGPAQWCGGCELPTYAIEAKEQGLPLNRCHWCGRHYTTQDNHVSQAPTVEELLALREESVKEKVSSAEATDPKRLPPELPGGLPETNVQQRPASPSANPAFTAALVLAGQGYPVFPVKPRGKTPIETGWQDAATSAVSVVKTWEDGYPGCNFGIKLGHGLWAVEVDPYQGGPHRLRALRDMGMPVRVMSVSGRGVHVFGRGSAKNGQKLGPGLTVRSDGYFVVAPGSVHPLGRQYGRRRHNWCPASELPTYDIPEPEKGPGTAIEKTATGLIAPGERHEALKVLASRLHNTGMSRETAFESLRTYANNDLDLSDGRIVENKELEDVIGWYWDKDDPWAPIQDNALSDTGIDFDEEELKVPAPISLAIPQGGFAANLVDWMCKHSMVPAEFALAVALMSVAAINQQGRTWAIGTSEYGLALWLLCLAQAGGKKSASLSGLYPLEEVAGDQRLPQSVTAEALPKAFESGRTRWAAHTEFGAFMKESEKQYMLGVQETYTSLWDGQKHQGGSRLRVGSGEASLPQYASLTMIGMATLAHFQEWSASRAIEKGFLTRFLIVPQTTKVEYKALVGSKDTHRNIRGALALELRNIQRLAVSQPWNPEPPGAAFTDDAWELMTKYDDKWSLRDDLPPALGPFAQRLGANVYRLASTYALAEGRLEADIGDAEKAMAFSEYCRVQSWPIIQRYLASAGWQGRNLTTLEATLERLMKRSKDDGWVAESVLKKNLSFYGSAYNDAITHLIDSGSWEATPGRNAGSRKLRRRG